MERKNIVILGGLFVVLLLAAFLVLQKPGEQSSTSAIQGPMFTIDSTAVEKIQIQSPTSSVTLEKRGTEWFVTAPVKYKADQSNATQVIQYVKAMEMKGVVSSKPEKFQLFQVDSTALLVTLYEKGTTVASFHLGKMGASYTETYTRKENSNEVLLTEGAPSYVFNRPVKDWRDKKILSLPQNTIKEIGYQYGDTSFTLSKPDSIWMVGKDKAVQTVVDGILTALSNFQAENFVDSLIFPKINAVIACGSAQLRFSFDKATNKYFVRSSDSPQWFITDTWKANQLLKRKKEILGAKK